MLKDAPTLVAAALRRHADDAPVSTPACNAPALLAANLRLDNIAEHGRVFGVALAAAAALRGQLLRVREPPGVAATLRA